MIVIGIDLAGPANPGKTALAAFSGGRRGLIHLEASTGWSDEAILGKVSALAGHPQVFVGLDAPLSYNSGGGDRPGDRKLRRRLVEAGMRYGSVMTPTMTKMAYLTLRGVCVARALAGIRPRPPRVVEVHPGGSLALHGAPIAAVRRFKKDSRARRRLLHWLESNGLQGVARLKRPSDHLVAACGCAYAAWKWAMGREAWRQRASRPFHPFDFAC